MAPELRDPEARPGAAAAERAPGKQGQRRRGREGRVRRRGLRTPGANLHFTRQNVRPLDAGNLNAGLVLLQTDGTPTLIYASGSLSQYRVWAAHLPGTDDAGLSVSLAYQISRGEVGGGVTGRPLVQTAQNGEIRIAYLEQYNSVYSARYVTWNGDFNQTPTDVTVGSYNLGFAEPLGFALDAQDRPGIVSFPTDNSVVLATNAGSGWQMTTIGTEIIDVDSAALAFDANGVPSVFWDGEGFGGEPSGFAVTSQGSNGWSSALFDPQTPGAQGLIAGRDGLGRVEIFYFSYPSDQRAIGTAGAWTLRASVPDPSTGLGEASAVAFGAGNEIHVAYVNDIQGVMYAYFDGCTWSTQVVDSDTTVGDDLQIALDSSGAPHFSYQSLSILSTFNPTAGDLWYASPAP